MCERSSLAPEKLLCVLVCLARLGQMLRRLSGPRAKAEIGLGGAIQEICAGPRALSNLIRFFHAA